jgi:leucyl aminopeptidase
VRLARDLTNTPSLEKSPDWLADQVVRIAGPSQLDVVVRDEAALAAEGFGGILAVGAGSSRGPRLIEMSWRPRGAKTHVVLIGKGITFDSGGLSIKPADGMPAMKTDMAGGAAVIAAMSAVSALGVRARVTGLVPAAENLPSGSAQRPGDVIRQYGGQTVEVLNTDAEGRLVLADALAYAAARLRPDVMVDLATLTGAASIGLGRVHGAMYANDDALAAQLLAAASAAGEQMWRMPLVEDYRSSLDSPVADLRNIGDPQLHFSGGSVVAALFLREFTAGRSWAHLDIAGPARSDKDDGETSKGGTGYGVRMLLRWLDGLR